MVATGYMPSNWRSSMFISKGIKYGDRVCVSHYGGVLNGEVKDIRRSRGVGGNSIIFVIVTSNGIDYAVPAGNPGRIEVTEAK
jgi:hypothetical protein